MWGKALLRTGAGVGELPRLLPLAQLGERCGFHLDSRLRRLARRQKRIDIPRGCFQRNTFEGTLSAEHAARDDREMAKSNSWIGMRGSTRPDICRLSLVQITMRGQNLLGNGSRPY